MLSTYRSAFIVFLIVIAIPPLVLVAVRLQAMYSEGILYKLHKLKGAAFYDEVGLMTYCYFFSMACIAGVWYILENIIDRKEIDTTYEMAMAIVNREEKAIARKKQIKTKLDNVD